MWEILSQADPGGIDCGCNSARHPQTFEIWNKPKMQRGEYFFLIMHPIKLVRSTPWEGHLRIGPCLVRKPGMHDYPLAVIHPLTWANGAGARLEKSIQRSGNAKFNKHILQMQVQTLNRLRWENRDDTLNVYPDFIFKWFSTSSDHLRQNVEMRWHGKYQC